MANYKDNTSRRMQQTDEMERTANPKKTQKHIILLTLNSRSKLLRRVIICYTPLILIFYSQQTLGLGESGRVMLSFRAYWVDVFSVVYGLRPKK